MTNEIITREQLVALKAPKRVLEQYDTLRQQLNMDKSPIITTSKTKTISRQLFNDYLAHKYIPQIDQNNHINSLSEFEWLYKNLIKYDNDVLAQLLDMSELEFYVGGWFSADEPKFLQTFKNSQIITVPMKFGHARLCNKTSHWLYKSLHFCKDFEINSDLVQLEHIKQAYINNTDNVKHVQERVQNNKGNILVMMSDDPQPKRLHYYKDLRMINGDEIVSTVQVDIETLAPFFGREPGLCNLILLKMHNSIHVAHKTPATCTIQSFRIYDIVRNIANSMYHTDTRTKETSINKDPDAPYTENNYKRFKAIISKSFPNIIFPWEWLDEQN